MVDAIHIIHTPPDEQVKPEGGIKSMTGICISDIRTDKNGNLDLGIVDGVVTRIPIKRKGTYHGKRYDRTIIKTEF